MRRPAPDERCVVCQQGAAHRLQWDSDTGPCDWQLCEICIVSRVAQTFQGGRNYIVDGKPLQDLKEFVSKLPTNHKCCGCGAKINGAHWHFANGAKVPRAVGGRAFYCGRQCCPSTNCHPATDPATDWDDLEDLFDEDEELLWDEEDEAAVSAAKVCTRCEADFYGNSPETVCPRCHAQAENPEAWDTDEWDF